MNDSSDASNWLKEHKIKYLELIVSDMAGIARGKVQPIDGFEDKKFKLPLSTFGQTITGDYYMPDDNVGDRDMEVRPDLSTLRLVPWATEPTASVFVNCYDLSGNALGISPRVVLQRVLERFEGKNWHPLVAPEVEFYLSKKGNSAPGGMNVFDPDGDNAEDLVDPYGFDHVHDLGKLFQKLSSYCEIQGISIGAVSQELGPSQFEINFDHGDPLKLADDVFLFKRTLKRVAHEFGLCATFLAKPDAQQAGSSLHIHQSIYDGDKQNIFSNDKGEPSKLFEYYLGGLQEYMRAALLLFAPYENSYRRFASHFCSPINLEWGIDNRTVGLRVPESDAKARRVENRLAGSDVNPYLVIAGTLGCGYLGMTQKVAPRKAVELSAFDSPFALHRHLYQAIDGFSASAELREVLGDEFVTLFSAVKEMEGREFQQRIPEWEREFMVRAV